MSYNYSINGYIDQSGAIAAATPHQFYKEGQILYNNEAPFTSSCQMVLGSSNSAYWVVTTGGNTYGFVGQGEQVNTATEFGNDNALGVSLPRGILRTALAISQTELEQIKTLKSDVAANTIKNRLVEIWKGNFSAVCRGIDVQSWVGTGTTTSLASGASVPGLYGLTYLLNQAQTSGSYGGLSLATYPQFALNYLNVGGTITTAQMDHGFSVVQEQAGSVLDSDYVLWASPRTEAALKQIADTNTNPAVRFNADEKPASYMLGARRTPSGRKSRISYNGVPVFSNSAMHAAGLDGYLVLMNPNDVCFDVLPYSGHGMATVEKNESMVERFGRVTSEIGLPLFYQTYPNLGGVYAAFATTEMQIVWKAPNRMFVWYGITTS
jgi:hypothetical protein